MSSDRSLEVVDDSSTPHLCLIHVHLSSVGHELGVGEKTLCCHRDLRVRIIVDFLLLRRHRGILIRPEERHGKRKVGDKLPSKNVVGSIYCRKRTWATGEFGKQMYDLFETRQRECCAVVLTPRMSRGQDMSE